MINLTVFLNKDKSTMKGFAFMTCPNCKEEILLDTDKITYCKRCRHKVAYKLVKDNRFKNGFSKIIYSPVRNLRKQTLNEVLA